jgi:hypothetical protein
MVASDEPRKVRKNRMNSFFPCPARSDCHCSLTAIRYDRFSRPTRQAALPASSADAILPASRMSDRFALRSPPAFVLLSSPAIPPRRPVQGSIKRFRQPPGGGCIRPSILRSRARHGRPGSLKDAKPAARSGICTYFGTLAPCRAYIRDTEVPAMPSALHAPRRRLLLALTAGGSAHVSRDTFLYSAADFALKFAEFRRAFPKYILSGPQNAC